MKDWVCEPWEKHQEKKELPEDGENFAPGGVILKGRGDGGTSMSPTETENPVAQDP